MTARLANIDGIPGGVAVPAYDRSRLTPGIVHIGPGAFFRAHMAVFTDGAIAHGGMDWGIEAVSPRSTDIVTALNEQNGLFTLLVRDRMETHARIVGSVVGAHALSGRREKVLARLTDPQTRIVSLTITEKAYTDAPDAMPALLVEAIDRRRKAGDAPFTPLSCDNLPANGKILERIVLDLADRRDASLRRWIEVNIPFPSTMVDRITPARTATTLADARRLTGRDDRAAVEAEPFAQWVIEDRFCAGRPLWEAAGAIMVSDVAPYEKMKLRMLNGAHSLMAYLGQLRGHEFVRHAVADPDIASAVGRHLAWASSTLSPVPGVNLATYAADLIKRFANPAIAHRTAQIAMDGTQKLPQRILEPAVEMLAQDRGAEPAARLVAAWMAYVRQALDRGGSQELRDPRGGEIAALLQDVPAEAGPIAAALLTLPGLFPDQLQSNAEFRRMVLAELASLCAAR